VQKSIEKSIYETQKNPEALQNETHPGRQERNPEICRRWHNLENPTQTQAETQREQTQRVTQRNPPIEL